MSGRGIGKSSDRPYRDRARSFAFRKLSLFISGSLIPDKKENVVKKVGPNHLALIHSDPISDLTLPPPDLGETGAQLWRTIQQQYLISDAGGLAMLKLACESADRAQSCRKLIDEQGEIIWARGTARDHPLLKHELGARSFTVRTLQRLGLDLEPIKGIGRPPGS
jgi:hypothetical protein